MVTTAFVDIWGRTAGAVGWRESDGLCVFEYDPAFVADGWELSPVHMPLSAGRRIFSFPDLRPRRAHLVDAFYGLPGLLADALPDDYGHRLIDKWLSENGRPPGSMNPVEKLCFMGTRGMGALEFRPARFPGRKNTFQVEMAGLVEMARRMLADRSRFETRMDEDTHRAMMDILRIGTSAGGARPKAIIAYNPQTRSVRSGQTRAPRGYSHWLIKLDGVSEAQLGQSHGWGRVEMAYYLMARDCGIDIMESRLLEENGRAHFMTRRFDREGPETKHHIQTLAAIQHFNYHDVYSYSYEQVFQTMRLLRLPYPQAEQMFRRMAFNVMARNCDDHVKNFAFRMKRGEPWELAPAYDLCHAYRPGSAWVSQHALSVNGKRTDIGKADLLAVARSMNIKKAGQIVTELGDVISQWPDYAGRCGVERALMESISATLRPMTDNSF